MRTIIAENPFGSYSLGGEQLTSTWLMFPTDNQLPNVVAYRLRFGMASAATVRIHVSADERYELFVDGRRLGRGPERGEVYAWLFETYDLDLWEGDHVFVARVWALGALAPLAQVSTAPGFLLAAQPPFDVMLSTGLAAWEVRPLTGYSFALPTDRIRSPWFTGPNQTTDAALVAWEVEGGGGDGWESVPSRHEDAMVPFGIFAPHPLRPAMLPGQLDARQHAGTVRFASRDPWDSPYSEPVQPDRNRPDEVQAWQDMVDGRGSVHIPPRAQRRVILDFGQYYCAYPHLVTSGGQGSTITVCWAEALYLDAEGHVKGQRDSVEECHFVAVSRDIMLPDGGADRTFSSLWWRCGRYLQLLMETSGEPLTIEELALDETRYPLEMESHFVSNDEHLKGALPIMLRGLQMCSHETYMDCPYYEQMMYVGDTRLEALATLAISRDDRLPRKAMTMFDRSRLSSGLTQARYPGHDVQIIPPFSLWWIAMAHDFALWRGDRAFVGALMPGVRAVADAYLQQRNAEGVVSCLEGWNFTDWVGHWPLGNPPGATTGVSALLNWQVVYTLVRIAELEDWAGEPELAGRAHRHALLLAERLKTLFWDDQRGLFADDASREHYSEHTQCLALLSGLLDEHHVARVRQGLLTDPTLTRTTIYFTHYLFEAYRSLGAADALFRRLGLWFDLPDQGFKTPPESPEPTRSDCHGWGAHPLYHCFATILGIRPTSFGFGTLEIAPLLGPLTTVSGSLMHPQGSVDVELHLEDGQLNGTITLPPGVSGTFRYGPVTQSLVAGTQRVGGSQ